MSTLIALVVITVLGLVVAAVVSLAREGRLGPRSLLTLAGICGAGLVVMTLTDWPQQSLAEFWARHSVVSAVLSTLLLIGSGYLAFEARENVRQRELSASLAAAAFGGVVDHVIDVDLALSWFSGDDQPAPMAFEGKPLRWIRPVRDRLPAGDPRDEPPQLLAGRDDALQPWRQELVDQCVRRVMGGMKEWGALLGLTSDGRAVLVRLGDLRNVLLLVEQQAATGGWQQVDALVRDARRRCQVLALGLEVGSGTAVTRAGVRHVLAPGLEEPHVENVMTALRVPLKAPDEDRARALEDARILVGQPLRADDAGAGWLTRLTERARA